MFLEMLEIAGFYNQYMNEVCSKKNMCFLFQLIAVFETEY